MNNMVKRGWVISDIHWGCRSNSNEWLEICYKFHVEFLIPYLKKNAKPGDILFISGDIFDSRQSIGLNTLNMALEVYSEIAKILPIEIILGNHDIFMKDSNKINSVKPLGLLPNITVYEEPVMKNWGGKKVLLMPWRKNHDVEREFLLTQQADYLLCHTDFIGAKNNAYVTIEKGNSVEVVKNFRKVFSGHIHWRQKINNVTFFGCPYQMTRSDIGNDKGLWLLDFEKETEEFIVNPISPKFLKIHLNELLNLTPIEIGKIVNNNFVDLTIPENFLDIVDIKELQIWIKNYRKLNIFVVSETAENAIEEAPGENSFDLLEVVKKYIEKLPISDNAMKISFNKISELYSRVEQSRNNSNDII